MTSVSRDGAAPPTVRGTVAAASEATAAQVHGFPAAYLPADRDEDTDVNGAACLAQVRNRCGAELGATWCAQHPATGLVMPFIGLRIIPCRVSFQI